MAGLDYKKEYKELYQPPQKPALVTVPSMRFIMADGEGYPGDNPEYQEAIQVLMSLSYAVKMMPRRGYIAEGYFDYIVPPLEGLWWIPTGEVFSFQDKSNWLWTMMVRQPDFVDSQLFELVVKETAKKKLPGLQKARLEDFEEGLSLQIMHVGPFSTEPESLAVLEYYMAENGYQDTFYRGGKHHEIYLSDPRKCDPSKMKTVLRQPVEKV